MSSCSFICADTTRISLSWKTGSYLACFPQGLSTPLSRSPAGNVTLHPQGRSAVLLNGSCDIVCLPPHCVLCQMLPSVVRTECNNHCRCDEDQPGNVDYWPSDHIFVFVMWIQKWCHAFLSPKRGFPVIPHPEAADFLLHLQVPHRRLRSRIALSGSLLQALAQPLVLTPP